MIMTDAENWLHRVEALFNEAVQLPPADRFELLRSRCNSNVALAREVERLLRAHDREDDFLQSPALGGAFTMPSPESLATPSTPRRIGPYQLVRLLGSGGIAHVWLARRVDGHFDKDVAIKIIKRGMDTDAILARFEQERQLLARLEHPNIARLIDGGATDDGLPYLVMEHVDGVPIDRYCTSKELSLTERVDLFREVCAAVQYAHQSLVIHRDLKPGNILVGGDGRPKLLDFGIAKLLGDTDGTKALTKDHRMLTPEYASPEQLRGDPITTASDVYSLGVVLYELLTGCKPYDTSQAISQFGKSWPDPMRPSSRVLRADHPNSSAFAPQPGARIATQLRGDLDLIILKSLAVDPIQRYSSAQQLADDLRLHQEHMPISARPPTTLYRARRFVERNLAVVIAAVIATAAILAGLAISTTAYFNAETARKNESKLRQLADIRLIQAQTAQADTRSEAAKVHATNAFLQELLSTNDPLLKLRPDIKLREVLEEAGKSIDAGALADQPAVEASVRLTIGRTYINMRMPRLAESHLRRALLLNTSSSAGEDLVYDESLFQLARCLCEQTKFTEGLALHHRALALQRSLAPDDQETIMRRLWSMSAGLRDADQLTEAESVLREALDISLRLHGPHSEITAESRFRLAWTLMRLRKLDESESQFREALALQREILGENHPNTGESLLRLGQTVEHAGRNDEAESLIRQACQVLRNSMGDQHPDTLRAQTNMARFLARRGKLDEAESLYAAVIEGHRAYHGHLNNSAGTCYLEMGSLHIKRGDLPGAEALMRQSVQVFKDDLGEDHPSVQQARSELADLLISKASYIESEQILLDYHASATRMEPSSPGAVKSSIQHLIKLYESWCKAQPGTQPCVALSEWRERSGNLP